MRNLLVFALLAGALEAQTAPVKPQVENAQADSRAFAGSLETQLTQLGSGPFWAAYAEPMGTPRRNQMCNWNEMGDAPIRLEGQTTIVILIRIAESQLSELKVISPDCRLDAGGLPFHWIENVPAAESVRWLQSNVTHPGVNPDRAISAIAMHDGAAATAALQDLTAARQPERVREKAAFWIGTTRAGAGVELLTRMLATDPSQKVREQVVFALSQSKDPAGLTALVSTARSDKDPHVRSKALFWLAQKAEKRQSLDAIESALANDPERSVKEQAVFALKQLPNNEGTPALIQVARNHADPAIRRKAMFWLGQSSDPRAIDFFASVLKP